MGRIRTTEIKHASFNLVKNYPDKFIADFEQNKAVLSDMGITLAAAGGKRNRNKLAGYITRVVKRMKKVTQAGV